MIRKHRYLIGLIGVLAVAVGLLALLNMRRMSHASDAATLVVRAVDGEARSATLDQIKSMGTEEFEATLRTTSRPPATYEYCGVPLSTIIRHLMGEEALATADQVVARASDGYAVAFSVADVLADENLYVVFQQDGKPLAQRSSGGPGPMQLVVRREGFGQRWCKFLSEVEIQ